MNPGDKFLLGVDLHKDTDTLEAAYNDAAGVTAEFTRNLFVRINRELGASIDLDAVEHVARYSAERRQVEIFARFNQHQEIHVAPRDETFFVDAGELIHTEVSRKFELEDLQRRLGKLGFSTVEVFTDEMDLFANLLLERDRRAA
jgi:L-histidine N-alpha-methyltransferase